MDRIKGTIRSRLLVTGGAIAAAAAVLATVMTFGGVQAGPGAFFGGGDAGVQKAAEAGAGSISNASATAGGITVRISGFVSDDTRTAIGVVVDGRDDLGDTVLPMRRVTLSDQDGRVYLEDGGSANQENRREKTIYFPPLDSASTQLTLTMPGMLFARHADVTSQSGSKPPIPTEVDENWVLRFSRPSDASQSEAIAVDGSPHQLGGGSIVVTSVRQAATGTVVSGYLIGFSMDEIPEMILRPSLISAAPAPAVAFVGLTIGNGPQREQFEIRFPRTSGEVSLLIAAETFPKAREESASSSLRTKLGTAAAAAWQLSLPN